MTEAFGAFGAFGFRETNVAMTYVVHERSYDIRSALARASQRDSARHGTFSVPPDSRLTTLGIKARGVCAPATAPCL